MTEPEKLETILSRYEGGPADLIPVLQDIQDEFTYLPKDELKVVAQRLNVPLTRIYSVATFYQGFSLEPGGVHQVQVCQGTTCHLHGSQRLQEGVVRRLGIEPGQTTQDGQYQLNTVRCLGCCGLSPVMMIDGKIYGKVRKSQVMEILSKIEKEEANV